MPREITLREQRRQNEGIDSGASKLVVFDGDLGLGQDVSNVAINGFNRTEDLKEELKAELRAELTEVLKNDIQENMQLELLADNEVDNLQIVETAPLYIPDELHQYNQYQQLNYKPENVGPQYPVNIHVHTDGKSGDGNNHQVAIKKQNPITVFVMWLWGILFSVVKGVVGAGITAINHHYWGICSTRTLIRNSIRDIS